MYLTDIMIYILRYFKNKMISVIAQKNTPNTNQSDVSKNKNHYGSSGASQQKREKLDKKGECRDMAPVVLGQNGGASARLSGVGSK